MDIMCMSEKTVDLLMLVPPLSCAPLGVTSDKISNAALLVELDALRLGIIHLLTMSH